MTSWEGSHIDFHKEQTQRQTKSKHETGSKGDMGSELEETEHISYIKLMQLSFAVTSLHNEVLADNVYTRTPCPNLGIQAHKKPRHAISRASRHPLLTLFGSVRMHPRLSKQEETLSPFRQICSPLTDCTILVSLLNNKITSRIIQLFCLQAKNAQTAVTMRKPFPSSK